MLIGTWTLARIENTVYDSDGVPTLTIYDSLEDVDWHDEMWWNFKVTDGNTYVLYPGDTEKEQTYSYHIVDNHLYIDQLYDSATGTYSSDMFIRDITSDLVTFFEVYQFSDNTYRETVFYYARVN